SVCSRCLLGVQIKLRGDACDAPLRRRGRLAIYRQDQTGIKRESRGKPYSTTRGRRSRLRSVPNATRMRMAASPWGAYGQAITSQGRNKTVLYQGPRGRAIRLTHTACSRKLRPSLVYFRG